MSERPALTESRYRLIDTASKLVGLALVAAGLDVGGSTPAGLALALAGTACATLTVFLSYE
ncbi:hypothetical protein NDI56_17665 [Haloarcula sp. S1CR25-12]|uniref:DUF8120 domain-containing protein n=1 Tax=Haloarcula saliterrae TaxID=2950534 RepID=A0ABU2FHN3_9EURY|nr:hypothetical protein [Haloarcula sp. S1CR25-12]MDS0261231.1 hypothetical protein [Haloarcula sp. S1CR25-12]